MKRPQRAAAVLTAILVILAIAGITGILYIYHRPQSDDIRNVAYIYQNGELAETIPLYDVTETYQLTFTDSNGGTNIVEVRPGSIGVLSADCPDGLCVRQGFSGDSLLPIVCLPHNLVIQIKPETADGIAGEYPDAVTY